MIDIKEEKDMKITILNGSPRAANTAAMAKAFAEAAEGGPEAKLDQIRELAAGL